MNGILFADEHASDDSAPVKLEKNLFLRRLLFSNFLHMTFSYYFVHRLPEE